MKTGLLGLCVLLVCVGCAGLNQTPSSVRLESHSSPNLTLLPPSIQPAREGATLRGYVRAGAFGGRFVRRAHLHVVVYDSHSTVVSSSVTDIPDLPLRQTRSQPDMQYYSAQLASIPPRDGLICLTLHESKRE